MDDLDTVMSKLVEALREVKAIRVGQGNHAALNHQHAAIDALAKAIYHMANVNGGE